MPSRLDEHTYKNHARRPLEDLTFPVTFYDGVKRNIPACDKYWTRRESFSGYLSLIKSTGSVKTGAALEEWKAVALAFQENMKYLLTRRHHEFWSYMAHNKTPLAALCSFLENATPFYLEFGSLDKEQKDAVELYEDILNMIVRIIVRLLTQKESDECWISKAYLAKLVFSSYLITMPMLIDVIIAVGDASEENASVLKKIFSMVFLLDPSFKKDLRDSLELFKEAFKRIHIQAENEGVEGAGGGEYDDDSETPYDDVSLFTLDCAYSLRVLLDVCDVACEISDKERLGESIAAFYTNTIPLLYKYISTIKEDAQSLIWLNRARLQFLKSFRSIMLFYIESATNEPSKRLFHAEKFINLLTVCLSEQIFVVDYENMYPVKDDIETLSLICDDIENDDRVKYLLQGYSGEANSMVNSTFGKIKSNTAVSTDADQLDFQPSTSKAARINGSNTSAVSNGGKAKTTQKTTTVPVNKAKPRDIDLEISAVLDVFPDLGVGFIRKVLDRYDNKEEAISAMLENNLPPDLAEADRKLPYIPPDPQDKLFEQSGIQHFNVHDGDQYDILTQDNPNCIIKRGKGFPNAPKDAVELLDDKRHLAEIKHKYQQYSLVSEDEYDDEYDDSYDALLESESRVVLPKQLKSGLANVEDVSEDESNDDEQQVVVQEETASNGKSKMNFCENPEDVRARYEANRQSKSFKRGGGGGGRGGGNSGGGNKNPQNKRDVVGAPKGQGQDKETVRNRKFKEAHKSTRANHNRKAGAAYKRRE